MTINVALRQHAVLRGLNGWYFDLLQVHLQTQQSGNMRLVGMGVHVVRNHGPLALYNGLSASLLRQVRP